MLSKIIWNVPWELRLFESNVAAWVTNQQNICTVTKMTLVVLVIFGLFYSGYSARILLHDSPDHFREDIRVKRNVDEMHPVDQLRYFRDKVYISDEEEVQLKSTGDVMTYRFHAILPQNVSDNATIPGHIEYVEIRTVISDAIKSAIDQVPYDHYELEENYADIKYDGLNDKNETQVFVNGIVQLRNGTSEDLVKALESNSTNFVNSAIFGPFEANCLDLRAYSNVRSNTVYQIMFSLSDVPFVPNYNDLSNAMTQRLLDKILSLTRGMHRGKFGEFFFRSIPLELIEGPQKTTLVSLAILLEPNTYNMMDIDVVWKRKAIAGYLGEWEFHHYDYMIKETQFVPSAYKGYLVAKVLRSDRVVDTDQLWHDVGVPSLIGMTVVILLTIICAWEGYCCRKFFESNECMCCCGCSTVNLS